MHKLQLLMLKRRKKCFQVNSKLLIFQPMKANKKKHFIANIVSIANFQKHCFQRLFVRRTIPSAAFHLLGRCCCCCFNTIQMYYYSTTISPCGSCILQHSIHPLKQCTVHIDIIKPKKPKSKTNHPSSRASFHHKPKKFSDSAIYKC